MAWGDQKGTNLAGSTNSQTNPATCTHAGIAVAVGDLVVVVFGEQTALTVGNTPTDNLSNSYTATNAGTLSGTSVSGRCYYTVVVNAGTLTTISVAATVSTDNAANVGAVFTGPFQASPVDSNQANTTADLTTPFTCPATGTMNFAGSGAEVIIAWAVSTGSAVWTANSPLLLAGQQASQSVLSTRLGNQTVTTNGTVSPAFAGTNPTAIVLGTTTFRSLGAATPTTRADLTNKEPIIRGDHLKARSRQVAQAFGDAFVARPFTQTPAVMSNLVQNDVHIRSDRLKASQMLLESAFRAPLPAAAVITSLMPGTADSGQIIWSNIVYDLTAAPPATLFFTPNTFWDPPEAPRLRDTRAKALHNDIYGNPPSFVPNTFWDTPEAIRLRDTRAKTLSEPVFIKFTAPAATIPTVLQPSDADKMAPRPFVMPLSAFAFALPVYDYGFEVFDELIRSDRRIKVEYSQIEFISQWSPAATPSTLFDVAEQPPQRKDGRKLSDDGFAKPAVLITTSPIAGLMVMADSGYVVIWQNVVYDQTTGPVFPPAAPAAAPPTILDQDFTFRQAAKPFVIDGYVIPIFQQVTAPVGGSFPQEFTFRLLNKPFIIDGFAAPPNIGPGQFQRTLVSQWQPDLSNTKYKVPGRTDTTPVWLFRAPAGAITPSILFDVAYQTSRLPGNKSTVDYGFSNPPLFPVPPGPPPVVGVFTVSGETVQDKFPTAGVNYTYAAITRRTN